MLKDLTPDQILNLAFVGAHIDGVAHNITTPLSAILGRMELLQMRLTKIRQAAGTEASEAEFEKCLNDLTVIGRSCYGIDDTLKNCLKATQGIMKRQTEFLQLDWLLKGILAFLNTDMEFKHQTDKTFEFQENIPPVAANPVAFSLTFLELLHNARTAMLNAPEKRLSVAMSFAGGCIEISFRDTGCGIAPHSREELLGLLQSPCASVSEQFRESGLQRVGRLLQPHGVTYDIHSRPGDTLFMLRVPVVQSAQP
jgi:two-component system, NtrC family, sensor kinase